MRQILKYTYNFFWSGEFEQVKWSCYFLQACAQTSSKQLYIFSCHAIVSDLNSACVCSISVCCNKLSIWQFYLRSAAHAVLTSSKMPSWILRWYHLDYNFFLVYMLELSDNRYLQWLELYITSAVYILFVVRFSLI